MKKATRYHFLLCLLVCCVTGGSQNETKKWYFGIKAGLDFMTSPPTILTNGAMSTIEGCAAISDASGNLLFYTNGINIWNQTHTVMPNGSGLTGNSSTTQSGIIVKQPGNSNIYFVFTLGEIGGTLDYSIVDMALSAGIGSVTTKNVLLSNAMSEKLTSVRHCNGVDFWVVAHSSYSNYFKAFLVTTSGIGSAVLSQIGSNAYSSNGTLGCIKISPNGKKIGAAFYGQNTFELYDFDSSTGVISNSLVLGSGNNYSYPYGCEFSPDGTKFYGSRLDVKKIIQWDLCASSDSAIKASAFTFTSSARPGSMQLASNGKIYVARFNTFALGVINNPGSTGSACSYADQGQSIWPDTCKAGLPNFITSSVKPPPPPFTYTLNSMMGCQTAFFNHGNNALLSCAALGYSLTGFSWNFGDPGSGSNNTSSLPNPIHVYPSVGTYTVQLILNYSCSGGADTITQPVIFSQPCISISSTSVTCANLGSATINVSGGIGPYSYTWMPTLQTGSTATGLSPGTYTILLYDVGNNQTYTSPVILTSPVPLTGSLFHQDSLRCFGAHNATATIGNLAGGSGNVNYLWSNGANSYTTAFTNSLNAGTWSVTVTDALTGCTLNESFQIVEPPPQNLFISASSLTACLGASIVLTGIHAGGTPFTSGSLYTYSWFPGPDTNVISVNKTTAGIYVYTLSSKDANDCLINNSITITFISNPVLSIGNVSICPLAVGTLSVSGANTYTWNNLSTGSTYTNNPSITSHYTVAGSAAGCTSSASASMITYPSPVPVISFNGPLCSGKNMQLFGYGGSTNKWSGPMGFSSSVLHPILFSVTPNNSGVYNLTVTSANGCSATATGSITVHLIPTISVAGATVCTSGSLCLSASSAGCTFLWFGPQNFTSNLQNPVIVNPSVNQSGTYSVIATSINDCTNSATALVMVIPPPSITVSISGNGTLCAQGLNGSPNSITVTSSGANTYTLSAPGNFLNVNPGGPLSPLVNMPPFQNTSSIGTVTLEGTNGICSSMKTVTLSVIPNPTISINSPTPIICLGKNFTYLCQGANTYTWDQAMTGLSTYTGVVTIASPSLTSVYSVIGSSHGCHSDIQTSTLTVKPLPSINVIPGTPTICLNSTINLIAEGTGTSYTWSPYERLNTLFGATVNAGPLTQQNYTVTASLDNCTNTAVITVSVLSLPIAKPQVSKPEFCLREIITLSGTGGVEFGWKGPHSAFYAGQQVTMTATSIHLNGTHTLTVTDQNGCKGSATIPIVIHPLPNGSLLGTKMQHCIPFCSDFKYHAGTGSPSSIATNWEVENKNIPQKNSFSFCFTKPGDYLIRGKLKDTVTGCINTQTYMVNAWPLPIADFKNTPEKPIEKLDDVIFTNASQGEKLSKWNWYFIDNEGYQSKNENTSYNFGDAGQFAVALTVSNAWGCWDSIVKAIHVDSDLAIYVPDVFSPNGDALNDLFLPVLRGIKLYDLSIYNRWGTRVFATNDTGTGWDGRYKGEECKNDVYTCKIKLSDVHGEMKVVTGSVLLSR